ncbi:hypothetical protein [Demequina salsinemoris]|uniref:hypothetical protein n=1 Tax=Demequina salsinemoris TaxID=577470 RepID=UPI000781307C|nr:hypothetical protein [Demequina salsinemoris]
MPTLVHSRKAALAAGITVVAGVITVAAAALLEVPTQSVAMPADDASAEAVVQAYLEALNGHDCDTAAALADADFASTALQWCDAVAGLDDIDVSQATEEDPFWSGLPSDVETVSVAVEFDLDWRLFHDDGSMPEGHTVWGYLLSRDSADAPWRIYDNGLG